MQPYKLQAFFSFFLLFVAGLLVPEAIDASASDKDDDFEVKCEPKFGLCGYVERQSGRQITSAKFELAMPLSEGLGAVRVNGLFGYVDTKGDVTITPKFDHAGSFSQGYAEVLINGKTGIINRSGKLVIEPHFARIIPLTKDTFIAIDGENYAYGQNSLKSWSSLGSTLGAENKQGLYHLTKGWITEQQYTFDYFDHPNRGLIWATVNRGFSGPWGLMRVDGSWQVKPTYTHVQGLNDGRAVVRGKSSDYVPEDGSRKLDPSGAVDSNGELVVPLKYEYLSYWSNGYGSADRKDKRGLVKKDGSLLGERYFDEVQRNEEGKLPRVKIGNSWHSIKSSGQLTTDRNEGRILGQCPNGLMIHERSGMAEFSHPRRKMPIGRFDQSYGVRNLSCTQPVSVKAAGKWGFVSLDGKLITDPLSFGDI